MKTNKNIFMDKFDYHYFRARRKFLDFIFITYSKIRRYFYNGNFTKKHITFAMINGKFQVTSTNHEDFILAIQKKINKLSKKYDRKKFIKLALIESLEGCNFIIFSPIGDDNKFIQFWTAENKLKFNFYANKTNGLKKYYLPIVGLLSESGFVNDEIENYRGSMVYKIDKGKDYISVDANFRKDIESASRFIESVFKDIYKIGSHKLIAKVE